MTPVDMTMLPSQTEPTAKQSKDLSKFREFLHGRAPGAHFYVVLLGLHDFDWAELTRALTRGFSFETLDHLQRNSGLPHEKVLDWLQISARTIVRRKQQGRFSPEESERLLRAARIFARALELFEGDRDAAIEWMLSTQRALGGMSPIDAARAELGAREVENLVGRLEHGVYS